MWRNWWLKLFSSHEYGETGTVCFDSGEVDAGEFVFPACVEACSEGKSKTKLLMGAKRDHLRVFVVTSGGGVHQRSEEAKNAGCYFQSNGLQSLAIETAEACAEWLRGRIREDLDFRIHRK